MAIMKTLEKLSSKNLDKFRMALVDFGGDRKVALSNVEGKDFTEITNLLVSTFTEDGAPAVTSELLKSIRCYYRAKKLDNKIAKLKSSADKTLVAPAETETDSAGAAGCIGCFKGLARAKGRTAHSKDDKIAKLKSSAAKSGSSSTSRN
ncbi:uncharacterized protein LOC144044981 [Vanacampus margaritifer]